MSREEYCAGNCFTVMEIAKERSWACQTVLSGMLMISASSCVVLEGV